MNAKIPKRILREKKTIQVMANLFCHHHHQGNDLCESCRAALDYASYRILKCPFRQSKPSCKICAIHCFQSPHKEHIKEIMAFSGPRMFWRHPFLALWHLWYEYAHQSTKKSC